MEHHEAVATSAGLIERVNTFPAGDIRMGVLEEVIDSLRPKGRTRRQWSYDFKAHLFDNEYHKYRDEMKPVDAYTLSLHYTLVESLCGRVDRQEEYTG